MRIALGVHVSTYEVVASLVDTTLPELGPVASRTVGVAAAPGGIAGAVSTALGFMRVQAMQNDLAVVGAAVVCENALQREIIVDALSETERELPLVVDIFHESLSDAFTPDVNAALLVGEVQPSPVVTPSYIDRRRTWPVAAAGACVLAALGGVTAWAMTSQPEPAGEANTSNRMIYPSQTVRTPSTTAAGSVTTEPPLVEGTEAPVDEVDPGTDPGIVPGGELAPPPVVFDPTTQAPTSTGGDAGSPPPTTDQTTPGDGTETDPDTDPGGGPDEQPEEDPDEDGGTGGGGDTGGGDTGGGGTDDGGTDDGGTDDGDTGGGDTDDGGGEGDQTGDVSNDDTVDGGGARVADIDPDEA